MWELPKNFDWTFMLGNELIQVCFGQYQTQLRFERDVTVSIEGNIEHRSDEQVLARTENDEQAVTSFLLLLGASINRVSTEEGNTLVFSFTNGSSSQTSLHMKNIL
jgi:hypothetical protein